jgi:heme-degrading monooxygenase HmoA
MTSYQWKSPLKEDEVAQVEREVINVLAGLPGFKAYYGIKVSDTEWVAVVVWESQAASEQARDRVAPAVQRIVGAKIVGQPRRVVGEVVLYR